MRQTTVEQNPQAAAKLREPIEDNAGDSEAKTIERERSGGDKCSGESHVKVDIPGVRTSG